MRVGSVDMFLRMATFPITDGTLDRLRDRYWAECAPIVRASAGNVGCLLLESVDEANTVSACTIWETEAHAVAYESSGRAVEVAGRVRQFFAGPPVVMSHRTIGGPIAGF